MYFQRFYDAKLAQASYLIGCQRTGEALIVDPNRDVEQYPRAAAAAGLRITQVTETHIHADFVSGARELARRAGAQLLLSGEGGEDWQYTYAAEDGARLLHDGEHFMLGDVRVDVLHTPGHTPEHLSFLITDTTASSSPWGILTGDFVFVGDVGRPDLLERAAGVAGTMEAGARALFASLRRFRALPDGVQLWPGHGAGSACGKALGALPSSTVGYERVANWALGATDEATFVREVLSGQPEPPRYFAEMKRINRAGPRFLDRDDAGQPRVNRMPGGSAPALVRGGALVVDARTARAFAAAHIPQTLNIPLNQSFTTWAGWLIPYDRDVYLLVDEAAGQRADEAVRDLAMIGLDRVAGIFGADALDAWSANGGALATIPQASVREVSAMRDRDEVHVLDVRNPGEWEAGHLPGVPNIPLGELAEQIARLPTDRPVVLHCQGGGRSAIAASLLRAHGVEQVYNMAGGFSAWRDAGLPVERDETKARR